MAWFGLGADKTVDAAANLVENTGNALDALFTSDDERNAAEILKAKIAQNPAAWAHQLNLINAQDSNWFNSGWRPGLGWVCVLSAFAYFVPQFTVATFVWTKLALATTAGQALPAYPVGDSGLWQLVALLLGGGVLRTIEKTKGIARN